MDAGSGAGESAAVEGGGGAASRRFSSMEARDGGFSAIASGACVGFVYRYTSSRCGNCYFQMQLLLLPHSKIGVPVVSLYLCGAGPS